MKIKYFISAFLISLMLASCTGKVEKGMLDSDDQAILVIADSLNSPSGALICFNKDKNGLWKQDGKMIPVVIGRHGFAWGRGINKLNMDMLPLKKEGDGKSPMGIFELASAFGNKPESEMSGLKFPYRQLTEMTECIDDPNSEYYTKIVERNNVDSVDWKSSEKMKSDGIWYQLGVFVEHNWNDNDNKSGSCIFLHNWAHDKDYTAGCTAMAPENMLRIVQWLDKSKHPVLIQLTSDNYEKYKYNWDLPDL